jgi:hypothetical protein
MVLAACSAALILPGRAIAQSAPAGGTDEPIVVNAGHPRLFLRPARLRLLRRERERASQRWAQFDALISGGAPMPEPGFAEALYYQVATDRAAGRKAIAWALGPGNDLRQLALVFDWCQDLLSASEKHDLAARIEKRISASPPDDSVVTASARALAAVALFDEAPQTPQRELERVVHGWWNGRIVPALNGGRHVISREDAYPLYELLHAFQDNVNLDLRESAPRFFKDFPIEHLLSYYPAAYSAPENDYYIGAARMLGEPDLRAAALSRAAELAITAYDVNAPETQVLQGWLMHDRFMLKSTFGAPYEFLWANPYQPGLSYYHVPLVFYASEFGRLFIRSSWDDTAEWFGDFDGVIQRFSNGAPALADPRRADPLSLTEATVCFGKTISKFQLSLDEAQPVFVVGLESKKTYQVEIDDEEMFEAAADIGGILELEGIPAGKPVGVRIRQSVIPSGR